MQGHLLHYCVQSSEDVRASNEAQYANRYQKTNYQVFSTFHAKVIKIFHNFLVLHTAFILCKNS